MTLDGLGRENLFTDLAFVLPDQVVAHDTSKCLRPCIGLLRKTYF